MLGPEIRQLHDQPLNELTIEYTHALSNEGYAR